ncbi:UDP-glucose dehydrogenase family protein [Leptothoe spongobia]|uniref:UDP-glucose 6-dehydrogenase n=1 Tax=Leptothoe spongobia TAU-MAC 1115 TaxID=1967444 RepID=A0A947DFL8_9CYAN|nr:UDP-glucose/GDP-mannose dehydrogenase family protein [Leptothoe spongobia]MBT9315870.1 UDP-glucose/GDP-mannose dehydrogenase family protein [Leptothoe spongobia TAU-MAC 1115]
MKVSIVGTGYVGLVSGVCLAEKGHQVTCVDIDQAKVDQINQGIPPIYEDGLEELLKKNIKTNLQATTDLRQAVMDSQVSLIAVGTPFDGQEIDLRFIKTVARQIGEVLKDKDDYHVVVVKSTVVPGTSDEVVLPIVEEASGKKAGEAFGIGMNPEFLKEGEAIVDFMNPDRIVLGGIDQKTLAVMEELYAVFPEVDQLTTNCKTAEMIKYTANSLLATMISFSNEIGNLCAATGSIDVVEVMKGVHLDKRLTPILETGERIIPSFTTYLGAGCGFGGSCFPKDVKALKAFGEQRLSPMPLLGAVLKVNADQPYKMLTLLQKYVADLANVRIAILGLAFKPGTDDMRESPAIPVINELLAKGAVVQAYDPIAQHEAEKIFDAGKVAYADSLETAIKDAQAILIMTRWSEFNALPDLLKALNNAPVVIDGRRMLDKQELAKYDGIGL